MQINELEVNVLKFVIQLASGSRGCFLLGYWSPNLCFHPQPLRLQECEVHWSRLWDKSLNSWYVTCHLNCHVSCLRPHGDLPHWMPLNHFQNTFSLLECCQCFVWHPSVFITLWQLSTLNKYITDLMNHSQNTQLSLRMIETKPFIEKIQVRHVFVFLVCKEPTQIWRKWTCDAHKDFDKYSS